MTKKTKEVKSKLLSEMDAELDVRPSERPDFIVKRKPVRVQKEKSLTKVAPEIKREEAIIPYRVFEKISGRKWDQMAGFKSYVKRETLGPMTVVKWHEALQAFMNKPVN